MEQQEVKEVTIGEIKGYSLSDKFKGFVKQKLTAIILLAGCIVFVLKDAINWKINDEELWLLIIEMALTYLFTMYVVIICGKMGRQTGKQQPAWMSTMNYYSKAKEDITPHRNKLGAYCKAKTEEEKRIIQREIIDPENLQLEKLYEYEKSKVTRSQWKLIKRARKVKVIRLQEKDLISERGKNRKTKYGTYLGKSEKEFVTKNEEKNAIMKFLIPILLTYIGVDSIILANALSGLIKVFIILLSGVVNYFSNLDFVENELRNRFINKADALVEFKIKCDAGEYDEKVLLTGNIGAIVPKCENKGENSPVFDFQEK